MAIKHLHHLDLNLNQLKNTKLEIISGSDPTHVSTDEGRIIYNSSTNALKFNNGTGWITLDGSGDIAGVTAGTGLSGGGTSGTLTLSLSHLGIESLADAGEDAIMFWDDSVSATKWLVPTVATGIRITGTALSLAGIPNSSLSNSGVTVTAGAGMTGGGTVALGATLPTLNVIGGTGITANANDIAITAGGVGTTQLANSGVTLAKMANLAENNFIGRKTASAGVPETLTATEVRTILNVADGANNYALPVATASVLGGIKVGTTLGIASQILNVDTESIQDIVGGMVSGNTESDITVTYADGGVGAGKLNFSVDNTVLKTTGDYTMGGALTITGNLTVNGTTTTVNSSTVSVEDNMFEMANGNTAADSLDIGWYGLYLDGSTQKYATIFREASGDTFKVGSATTAPGNTVTDFTLGKFQASEFTGDLVGNATTATTLASSRSFSITGDGSATGVSFNGSSAVALNLVLDTVNSGVGSFGSASETATFTVNGKGLVTASTEQSIQITSSQVTDFNADAVSAVRSANSYAANVGHATATTVTVNHALGSQDVIAQVRNAASPYEAYMVEIEYTDANNIKIKTSAALGTNAARVMITRVG
jgi:hypothetical protein